MSKFQPVKFIDVDDMLSSLPSHEKEITLFLRDLIFESIPAIKERLSYNVPFYYGRKRICFIWPGSVPWGKTKEGVEFGFTRGFMLSDPYSYMNLGERKEVSIRTFHSVNEIESDILKSLLFEASEIDRIG